ncbi:MAG: hypothetical protein P1P63_01335 [Treponemataceae bacterium]
MAKAELFENLKRYRCSLNEKERDCAVKELVRKAKLKAQYFYTLKETCAILHCSKDELQTILHQYRLDAVLFLSVYRIPWYDLAGFILDDHEDTLLEDWNEYLRTLTRRLGKVSGLAGSKNRFVAELPGNSYPGRGGACVQCIKTNH